MGVIMQFVNLFIETDRAITYKGVWNLLWALTEVLVGLNLCQVISSQRLMRSWDHLISRHERMLYA